MKRGRICSGFAVLAGLALPAIAQGATFTVTSAADSGAGTLREAINAANSAADADTIDFALGAGPSAIQLTSELPVISTPLTIDGPGASPGPANSALTVRRDGAAPAFRVFTVVGADVTFEGLEINNGLVEGSAAAGGGIRATNGDVTLDRAVLSGNSAQGTAGTPGSAGCATFPGAGGTARGGGIHIAGGSLTLSESTVRNNVAGGGAGGLGNGCAIDGPGGTASGGGIAAPGKSLLVESSTISGNSALGGDAGLAAGSTPGGGSGGGIDTGSQDAVIANSTISGNVAATGFGGIAPQGGQGGGVNAGDDMTIEGSTLFANSNAGGFTGGGGPNISVANFPGSPAPAPTVTIRNTIVADGITPGPPSSNCSGPPGSLVSAGYNLESGPFPTCAFAEPTDQHVPSAGLGPLSDNGGPTHTHAVTGTSPALDKGDSGDLATDQRGLARPFDFSANANATGGDGSDIGAFEFTDTDGDGSENGIDGDDDGDGKLDAADSCPSGDTGWTSNPATDNDGDGCLDAGEDADDDNDGVPDTEDGFPLDASRSDGTPPVTELGGKKIQTLGKNVKVEVACNEACEAAATGKIVVKPSRKGARPGAAAKSKKGKKFKLGAASASIPADASQALRLKIGKKSRKKIAKLLGNGHRANAKVAVVTTDAAGNAAAPVKRTIKIKPKSKKGR